VRFLVEQAILAVDGVADVVELDTQIDTALRKLTITGRVRVTSGEEIGVTT
jgi:hypothetical protein